MQCTHQVTERLTRPKRKSSIIYLVPSNVGTSVTVTHVTTKSATRVVPDVAEEIQVHGLTSNHQPTSLHRGHHQNAQARQKPPPDSRNVRSIPNKNCSTLASRRSIVPTFATASITREAVCYLNAEGTDCAAVHRAE